MEPYFYTIEDGLFAPTKHASSPWEPGKQNGVALGGLLTFLLETVAAPVPMVTTRLTIDILSAAALEPIEGRTRVVREGKRIQLIESELVIDGRAVARASALRTRVAETPAFEGECDYPAPEATAPIQFLPPKAFGGTLETRHISGAVGTPGAAALWVKFGHQLVQGTPLSPLVRTCAIADWGGGLGTMLDSREWSYANLDITLHLTREPVGEWLSIAASTASAGNGVATSDMILGDRQGFYGRGHQTLFINTR